MKYIVLSLFLTGCCTINYPTVYVKDMSLMPKAIKVCSEPLNRKAMEKEAEERGCEYPEAYASDGKCSWMSCEKSKWEK